MTTLKISAQSAPGIITKIITEETITNSVCSEINRTHLSDNPLKTLSSQLVVTPTNILERSRRAEIVIARQIILTMIMYFGKYVEKGPGNKLEYYTVDKAGKLFGKDHSTTIHSIKTTRDYLSNKRIMAAINNILTVLGSSEHEASRFKEWLSKYPDPDRYNG